MGSGSHQKKQPTNHYSALLSYPLMSQQSVTQSYDLLPQEIGYHYQQEAQVITHTMVVDQGGVSNQLMPLSTVQGARHKIQQILRQPVRPLIPLPSEESASEETDEQILHVQPPTYVPSPDAPFAPHNSHNAPKRQACFITQITLEFSGLNTNMKSLGVF